MLSKIAGRVRGYFAGNYPENREEEQFHLNTRGDQLIALGLPELAEIVRMGNSWQVKTTSGQAALTSLPTTTAALTVYNGEPSTGKTYVIDSVGMWEGVVDATQTDFTSLFACLNKTPATVQTSALTPASLSSRANYEGRAASLAGATVTNDGWYPCGTSAPAMVTAIAGGIWKMTEVNLRGLYMVPPLGAFSIQSVKGLAAASQVFYTIRWHEVQQLWRP